jgi:hypothetical protein
MPAYGLCDLCDAEIMWGRTTKTGRPIPLDPQPCDDGNIAVYTDATGRLNARVLKKGETPSGFEKLVKAHFATCPKYPAVLAARKQRARDAAIARAPKPPEPMPANVVNIRTARRRNGPVQP